MNNDKSKLHQAWDVAALLTILSMGITGIWYFSHDHARLDFLAAQISEVKASQDKVDGKVDRIYELLTKSN